jgi:5-formyltetrahydrofolate cyclo-ligase
MNKISLRKQFLQKRKILSSHTLQHISQAIHQQFFTHFSLDKQTLHTFLPIIKQNEMNTWLIINTIYKHYPQIMIVIPKTDIQHNNLTHYFLTAETKLVKNQWGIDEPVNANLCDCEKIDMVLIPLLCFDKQGNRVGYGKGFYDKFLAECRADVIKIGLSLFEPVEHIDDVQAHDVSLDFCITPDKLYQFNQ